MTVYVAWAKKAICLHAKIKLRNRFGHRCKVENNSLLNEAYKRFPNIFHDPVYEAIDSAGVKVFFSACRGCIFWTKYMDLPKPKFLAGNHSTASEIVSLCRTASIFCYTATRNSFRNIIWETPAMMSVTLLSPWRDCSHQLSNEVKRQKILEQGGSPLFSTVSSFSPTPRSDETYHRTVMKYTSSIKNDAGYFISSS